MCGKLAVVVKIVVRVWHPPRRFNKPKPKSGKEGGGVQRKRTERKLKLQDTEVTEENKVGGKRKGLKPQQHF